MHRLTIVGADGRMGAEVREAADGRFELVQLIVSNPAELGDERAARLDAMSTDVDVVIDFSAPEPSVESARWCAAHNIAFVSGTTGHSPSQLSAIEKAADSTALILASNFSVGVNVLEHLVELAAGSVSGWDVEVFEAHHKHKVDSPSGTALTLGKAAARGAGVDFEEAAVYERHGPVGPRSADAIGFQVVRGGSIVGEHTVFFCGEGERIELTHRAQDRSIFARGAVRAAEWIIGKPAGRHSMRDVLFG